MTAVLEKIARVPVKRFKSQVDLPGRRPSGMGRGREEVCGFVYVFY